MLAVFPAKKGLPVYHSDFAHPTHTIPLSAHAIPAAAGGASPPAAVTRSGRGAGLDGLSLFTALPQGLQAQSRSGGTERFSARSGRRGGQERHGSAGGVAAPLRPGGRSRSRGERVGAHG